MHHQLLIIFQDQGVNSQKLLDVDLVLGQQKQMLALGSFCYVGVESEGRVDVGLEQVGVEQELGFGLRCVLFDDANQVLVRLLLPVFY